MNSRAIYFDPRLEWLLSFPVDAVPMLVEAYVVEMRADVLSLKVRNPSPEEIINLIHKMKGSLSMIGYHSLCDRAERLLITLRSQSELVATEMEGFIAELDSSIEALEQWCFDKAKVSDCL